MSEQEIKEGNKLIAEFCHVGHWQVWRKNGYKPHWSTAYISAEAATEAARIHYGIDADELEPVFIAPKYHLDWSELMPVVEKIEGKEIDLVISVVIKNNQCGIYRYKGSDYEKNISRIKAASKIEATWEAIVEFIKWYNNHKQEIK